MIGTNGAILQTAQFPFNREVLGRALGPAIGAGNKMSQWILKANGNVVPHRSSRPLSVDEIHNSSESKKPETFDAMIERRWSAAITPPKVMITDDEIWEEYYDDDEDPRHIPAVEDVVGATGQLICQHPPYDKLINTKVLL